MIKASGNLLGALLLTSCIVAPSMAAAQATTVEEVVVTGQRASDRDSLLKKRDAVGACRVSVSPMIRAKAAT